MDYPTFGTLKTRVQNDCDLIDEDFISAQEFLDYFNEGVNRAEAKIHSIYEDYFLDQAYIALTTGTSEYALPSEIYASKIRAIVYKNGGTIYEIKRIKDLNKFIKAELNTYSNTSQDYQYFIRNDVSTTGERLVLSPASRETSTQNVRIWFLRNAQKMTATTDVCDIPEWADYIVQHVKVRCYEKEQNPNVVFAVQERDRLEQEMIEALTDRVPDTDNSIEFDWRHYEEHA